MTNKISSLVLAALVVMSVFAASFAFTGAVAAAHNGSQDDTIADGGSYWAGQGLAYTGTADETLDLYKNESSDKFVREIKTDGDGHYVLSTSDLSGSYYLENTSGDKTNFEVRAQTFTAEFAEDYVSNGNTGNLVEFDGDSNRAEFNVSVTAEGLDDTELSAIFANVGTQGTDYVVDAQNNTVTLVDYTNNNDNEFDLNFSSIEKGEYTFEFNVDDSAASATESITVNDAGEANAQFSDLISLEERGDIVELTVELENTNTADIEVGGDDSNYKADLTVTDVNEDGEVTVYFNTYTAGDGTGGAYMTHPDSDDTVSATEPNGAIQADRLQSGTYDLSASAGGEDTDVAVISLSERSTDGATIHTAPKGATLDSLEAINDSATVDSSIAMDDQFIVQIDATGLEGVVQDSSVTSSDFVKGNLDKAGYLTIEQTNPDRNKDPKKLDVSQATFGADGNNDSYYLMFKTSDVNVEADEEYDATFTLDETSDYVEDENATEEVTSSLNFVERSVSFDTMARNEDGEKFLTFDLASDDSIEVSGETTIAAGSEINLRLRDDGDMPFLKTAKVTVQDDNTFASSFDMADAAEDAEFTTEARGLTSAITSYLNVPKASVSVSDATTVGSANSVTVDSANLPYGGFVVIHAEDGSALGVSDYLEAGDHSDIEIELDEPFAPGEHSISAMAHQDDGNQEYDNAETDAPYTADGAAVTADALITVQEPTYTVTVNVDGANGAQVTFNGETKTTVGGAATFEVENGNYDVTAEADGYQDASDSVEVNGADASVDLTLEEEPEPTYMVTVNVAGPDGAVVTLNGEEKAATDGTATFEVESGIYDVSASANDYQDASSNVVVDGADASVDLTLEEEPEPTYMVTVNVAGADGAQVTFNGETKTTVGGAATFEVGNGNYDVSASADGYLDVSGNVEVNGADASVDLSLEEEPEPTYMVTVNVAGADQAEVTFNGETKTTEDGAATFEVENGNYDVSASADGYQDASDSVEVNGADASVDLSLEEESTDDSATTDDSTSDDDTEAESPGFGAVVALAGIIGAALISLRRRD